MINKNEIKKNRLLKDIKDLKEKLLEAVTRPIILNEEGKEFERAVGFNTAKEQNRQEIRDLRAKLKEKIGIYKLLLEADEVEK